MIKLIWEIFKNKIFLRYAASGIGISLLEFVLMGFLVYLWHWWYLAVSALVFLIGLVLSYLIRKYWVFDHACQHNDLKQIYYYSAFFVASTLVNVLIMYVLVEKLLIFYILAQLLTNALLGVFNYVFNKLVTFKPLESLVPSQLTLSGYLAEK